MKRKMMISRGQRLRITPKGALGPRSCKRSLGRSKVSIVNGNLRPRVRNENRMKSQKRRSFKRSMKSRRQDGEDELFECYIGGFRFPL